jgi:hypothetical protein
MNFYHFPATAKCGAAVQSLVAAPVAGALPAGFVWCSLARSELPAALDALQSLVRSYSPEGLLQLHVSDLTNPQHPSRYDYSSHYEVLIFGNCCIAAQKKRRCMGTASAA